MNIPKLYSEYDFLENLPSDLSRKEKALQERHKASIERLDRNISSETQAHRRRVEELRSALAQREARAKEFGVAKAASVSQESTLSFEEFDSKADNLANSDYLLKNKLKKNDELLKQRAELVARLEMLRRSAQLRIYGIVLDVLSVIIYCLAIGAAVFVGLSDTSGFAIWGVGLLTVVFARFFGPSWQVSQKARKYGRIAQRGIQRFGYILSTSGIVVLLTFVGLICRVANQIHNYNALTGQSSDVLSVAAGFVFENYYPLVALALIMFFVGRYLLKK